MKIVKVTMILTVTDEFYDSELMKMKNEILSGSYQRELKDNYEKNKRVDAVKDVKMTFETIK